MKIFRRVRKKLIEDRGVKDYLLYAIGEILLVMIGILLALQVNNWNQHRINHKKETKALVDLKNEFDLNRDRIMEKQNLRKSIAPEIEKYVSSISSNKTSYEAYEVFHSKAFMFGMTNPSNGVIDALISSGEIALISNDTLKYYLADWKNQLENLYENEQILWEAGLSFIGSASSNMPNPSVQWKDWDNARLENAAKDLLDNIQYRNNLIGFDGSNDIVIAECRDVLSVLEKILRLLNEEIKGRNN